MVEAALLAALLLACLGGALLVARGDLHLWRATAEEHDRLFRAEIQYAEALRLAEAQQKLADLQRLTEAALGGGTEAVRLVHKGIAAVPFTVLEAIPATRDTTRVVRQVHDAVSDGVYGGLKAINRGIGAMLRQSLDESARGRTVEKPVTQDRQPSVEKQVPPASGPPQEPGAKDPPR